MTSSEKCNHDWKKIVDAAGRSIGAQFCRKCHNLEPINVVRFEHPDFNFEKIIGHLYDARHALKIGNLGEVDNILNTVLVLLDERKVSPK